MIVCFKRSMFKLEEARCMSVMFRRNLCAFETVVFTPFYIALAKLGTSNTFYRAPRENYFMKTSYRC